MANDGTAECFFGDDDSDEGDEVSVKSAISNESDFEDEEDADYFALDLMQHLPQDMASKLLKNLRAKEKAVQDLLQRNRNLLDSCRNLDDENQTLTERLKEADDRASAVECATSTAAGAAQAEAAPPAPVDISVFQQMEMGKEKKILKLSQDNERLLMQVRRLDEANQRMEEALVQTKKDLKKAQQQSRQQPQPPPQRSAPAPVVVDQSVLDEEERLFQELQGKNANALALQKMQESFKKQRDQFREALQALLLEDLQRIERWGSDAAAVLMAVEGLEKQLGGGSGAKDAKSGGSKKNSGSKASVVGSAGANSGGGTELLQEVSARLIDDFESLKARLDTVEKAQLILEQTARGIHDGAESAAAAAELDSGIAAAETEAEWIREHNAAWINRVQALTLAPTAVQLGQTEEMVRTLLASAPPGLLPGHVEQSLQDTSTQLGEFRARLHGQAKELEELQADSVSFGQRIKSLQAAHRTHRSAFRERLAEELQRSGQALEEPLLRMRDGLRLQGEVMVRTRGRMSSALDEIAAACRRGGACEGGQSGSSEHQNHLQQQQLNASTAVELREVRSMGKKLTAGIEEGARQAQERMTQVLRVICGEEPPNSQKAETEPAKRNKKGKKKASGASIAPSASPSAPSADASSGAALSAGGAASSTSAAAVAPSSKAAVATDARRGNSAANGADAGYPEQGGSVKSGKRQDGAIDEEAKLRAEFHAVFDGGKASSNAAKGRSESDVKRVLSGPELLQELQSLRSDAEALEARMAARLRARSARDEGDVSPAAIADCGVDADAGGEEASHAQQAPAKAASKQARRKKMYA